jgi:hypothetical protein
LFGGITFDANYGQLKTYTPFDLAAGTGSFVIWAYGSKREAFNASLSSKASTRVKRDNPILGSGQIFAYPPANNNIEIWNIGNVNTDTDPDYWTIIYSAGTDPAIRG